MGGAEYVVLDHLSINGSIRMSGNRNTMQYLDVWHGGPTFDGNWAGLRVEWGTDCLVHHNYVHDIEDTADYCAGSTFADTRETGLKEFASTRTIWEFNTVRTTQRWGFDLHRNSYDLTVRFNRFENIDGGTTIRVNRGTDNHVYGNVCVSESTCVEILGRNELVQPETVPQYADVHHNTSALNHIAWKTNDRITTTIQNNAVFNLQPPRSDVGNIVAPDPNHSIDYNAYDSDSYYHWGFTFADPPGQRFTSLSAWQAATGYDAHSQAGAEGYCQFVDPPTSISDSTYDLHVTGPCTTMASDGGEVGAYGITSCVGRLCGELREGTGQDAIPPANPSALRVQ